MKTTGWANNIKNLSVSFLLGCVSVASQILLSSFIAPQHPTYAQSNIVPDNTLGSEASEVIPNFGATPNELITGGAQRGQNLFHSFREFNVGENRGAYFLVFDPNIQNILARVTGSNRSEILGTLGTRQVIDGDIFRSNANLFLINPNGIIFGENARLDVGASFVATTANGLQFGNQGNFSATNAQTPGVLTISPSALFFDAVSKQGVITVNQSLLRVAPEKNLTLVGGDISLSSSTLSTFGGRIELGAIQGTGIVRINQDGNLDLPENLTRANVNIANSLIGVSANNGGSITINADNLNISGSTIQAGIRSGLGTVDSQAGNITINTTGKLQVAPQSFIINWVFPNAIGQGGDIRINTNSMSITDNNSAYISASTWGKGNAGSVVVKANNDIALNGSRIFSIVETGAEGNAGNIEITTRNLSLTSGGRLNASTFGQGNGGKVIVNASERVSIDGVNSELRPSAILNTVENEAFGQGGDIQITTGSLSITNSGKLDTSVFGRGIGGNIIIDALNTVSVDGGVRGAETGSSIFSTLEETGVGTAGNIEIKTASLFLTNGGEIQSLTRGQGNAGNITVDTRDSILIDGFGIQNVIDRGSLGNLVITFPSGIFSGAAEEAKGNAGNILIRAANQVSLKTIASIASDVSPSSKGNAGNIDIITDSLSIIDNAFIRTATFGQGNAGDITIRANDRVFLDKDGEISSSVAQNANGNGGNISITTGSLILDNDTRLTASTDGQGNAGNITIKADDRISLDNDAAIGSLVNDEGIGKGGDIRISTGSLSIAGAAQLDSSTFGEGDAGDVIIDARDTVLFTGAKPDLNLYSGILSTAEGQGKGNGGNIGIIADSVVVADGATLSTITTKQGNAGNITIQARNEINLVNEGDLRTITRGEGNAGNISLNAINQLNLNNNSTISSAVAENAKGNGGTIDIEAQSLLINNGSRLQTNTFGQGNAGDVTINVRSNVSLSGFALQNKLPTASAILSRVENSGVGDAGDIRINAKTFFMADNSLLAASTEGQGNSGNIFIDARNQVSLDSRAIISNIVGDVGNPGEFGDGKGGTIRIDTATLSMLNGSQLQASTFGRGNAGDIIINARENFLASGFGQVEDLALSTAVFSVVAENSKGDGGNIRVNTGSLFVLDGVRFNVSTSGLGRAGNITIDARDAVVVDGISRVRFPSELSTATQRNATGRGGTITVNTNSFRVSNGGLVNAQTTSALRGGDITINANKFEATQSGRIFTTATNQGQAGNITLNADTINLSGTNSKSISGVFANTTSTASARGGNIQVNARQLNVSDSAQISVNSQGSGVAGDIGINAKKVELTDNAKIIAETTSQDGGNIFIDNANLLLLRRESLVSATAGEQGNGGNVNINSKFIIAIPKENSDIKANAFEGNGGRVQINTQLIFGTEFRPQETNESDITASSRFGVSGIVNINSFDDSVIRNNLDELPEDAINTNALIANSCIARRNQQNGSFFVTGSGGLPARPNDAPLPSYSTGDVQPIPIESTKLPTQKRRWQIGDPVLEPSGVYELPNGKLALGKEC